jgi:hypothetical protein
MPSANILCIKSINRLEYLTRIDTNLKDDSGLLSNLKSNFGLVVSTSVDPLVEKEKTGPLLGLAEPKL